MTPSERITMWLSRRPLAEANQRLWIAAVLADGMRHAATLVLRDGNPEIAIDRIMEKAQEMEKAV